MEPKRTDLLNHLATKYNLKRYLEIGVQSPMQNFDKIICEYKVSVDPDPNAQASFCMTSDEFFELRIIERADLVSASISYEDIGGPSQVNLSNVKYQKYDLIFIDGLHTGEQVKKDFENALQILSPNGFIVLHDCNPLKEEHTLVPRPSPTGHWNGDVYKFAVNLSNEYSFTVDIDNGCRVFSMRYSKNEIIALDDHYTWEYFDKNRKHLLNLISWDEFLAL